MNDESGTPPTVKHREKLPYAAPKLAVYGDLEAITQNMATSGSDGGNGNNSKSM